MKKIIGIVIIVLVVVLVWFFASRGSEQKASTLDAVDIVGDFYHGWLKAVQQPTEADPNLQTLAKSPILSKALKSKIAKVQKDSAATIDPVLCQSKTPEEISIRRVSMGEGETQILVTSKDKSVANQALVVLNKLNDGWYINDIQCSLGEFAPEREFSFEQEGFLLKNSISAPYNPKNWHLVFAENGEAGHVVPLLFDAESQCTDLNKSKSVCKPDQLTEAMKVLVRGQMTESGAKVKQLELVK